MVTVNIIQTNTQHSRIINSPNKRKQNRLTSNRVTKNPKQKQHVFKSYCLKGVYYMELLIKTSPKLQILLIYLFINE